ncbi:MAG: nucleotide-binding universal stress UspA family protein [Polaribacter sp.]|jgi:nucleotide-binding universal stress UspA family protein
MNRILVPIDFSDASANALIYANDYALEKGMHLTLLYCYPRDDQNRMYDFGKEDYDDGIQNMLIEFYKIHIGGVRDKIKFLARMGSVVDKLILISSKYSLIIISGNPFNSTFQRWIGSKSSGIASNAKCPVLIIPTIALYDTWVNIWHFKRKENESAVIKFWMEKENIDFSLVKVKTLKQNTFTSIIWESIVKYVHAPTEETRQLILNENLSNKIDLIILVSHTTNSFQLFLNDAAIQIMFEFGIPVMICQAK